MEQSGRQSVEEVAHGGDEYEYGGLFEGATQCHNDSQTSCCQVTAGNEIGNI